MTFIYPAVFTPNKEGPGYHAWFPDLEGCAAEGPDLEDTMDNAREAAYNWICVELEEENADLPEVSHEEDLELEEGSFVRQMMIVVKLMPDND
ncbi:MAG: type II toxin-antitoxin system HicB family antitoxin [Hungatella sp.]|jgi:predicted RNase H-like HicB family nuclease|nr:type II toxin-antitoxin system HicB family antitoxin [Hungatella sp.]